MIICISGNYRSGKSGFGVEISKKYVKPTVKDRI